MGAAVAGADELRKRREEPERMMSFRCPDSVREYLSAHEEGQTGAIISAVELMRDLEQALEDYSTDLIIEAAKLGKEYSSAKAETLAAIIRRCLKADKTRR